MIINICGYLFLFIISILAVVKLRLIQIDIREANNSDKRANSESK